MNRFTNWEAFQNPHMGDNDAAAIMEGLEKPNCLKPSRVEKPQHPKTQHWRKGWRGYHLTPEMPANTAKKEQPSESLFFNTCLNS